MKSQFEKKRYRLNIGDLGVEEGEYLVVDGAVLARVVSEAIDTGFRAGFRERQGEKDVKVDVDFHLNPRARISAEAWPFLIDWLAERAIRESRK